MRILSTVLTASLIAVVLSPSAFAREGGNGGDREPAGGAFMSSYPEQGSTGIQRGGPPRSVDIPRSSDRTETTGSVPRSTWEPYRQR